MSKSAKIILEAENNASKHIRDVDKDLERVNREVEKSGKKAKASTALMSSFFGAFGGPEMAEAVNLLRDSADATEDLKGEAAGAKAQLFAMKAAIAVGVFAAAVKVGQAIGDWAFGVGETNRKLKLLIEDSEKLASGAAKRNTEQLQRQLEDIEGIVDLEERRAKALQLINVESQGNDNLSKSIKKTKEELVWLEETWVGWASQYVTLTGKGEDELKEVLKQNEAILEARQSELDAAREVANIEDDRKAQAEEAAAAEAQRVEQSQAVVDNLRDQLELLKAVDKDGAKIAQNDALRAGDLQEALNLQRQITEETRRQKEAAEQQKELEKIEQDRISNQERIADLQESAIENIRLQVIELNQGAEAARRYALEQEGVDKATARAIARAEAKLQMIADADSDKPESMKASGPLQAKESRLLTRADSVNPMIAIGKQTAEATQDSVKLLNHIRGLLASIDRKPPSNVKVNAA